jgi:signal transduction histidine kinase
MADILFGYGIPLFEALLILLGIGIGVVFGYRRMHQRQIRLERALVELRQRRADLESELAALHQQQASLDRELAEMRARDDPDRFKALHDHLQSAIAHEFVKGLDYIRDKSEKTLEELEDHQVNLRDKQNLIVAKVHEMIQHAYNVVGLFSMNQEEPSCQMCNLKGLVEKVLVELYPYAQARGVVLQPRLANVEPIMLNRDFAVQILRNVIHNAIKYSLRDSVVNVSLDLRESGTGRQGKWACVEVKDRGRGIPEEDKARLFTLLQRGDGLVEPGTGIGLHYTRMLAERIGVDVTLAESAPQQGSTFRIVFPYR